MVSKNYRLNFSLVDSGALQLAINVLERAGKTEVVEELRKTVINGLPPIPNDIASFYADWQRAIETTDVVAVNTPIGLSYSTSGRLMLNYSLTQPQLCSNIEDAHTKVFKHFVIDKMKV
jgi:hypothetical protein